MLVDILMLFASAGLGQATDIAYEWAAKKASERNLDIEKALTIAYYKALQAIRDDCKQLPQWEQEKAQINARISDMERDALEILDLMDVEGQRKIPNLTVGSLDMLSQQQITMVLMRRLESEHKWLREAPTGLISLVRTNLIPVLVHQFRHELKHEPTVFRALVHDMLATTGKDVESIEKLITKVDKRLDEFIRSVQPLLKQPECLPVPLEFQLLIADKTKGFIGREFVFAELENFLGKQSNGYFTIEAHPGVGKSSILAEYVRRTGCVVYFNIRSQGINRAEQFLKSVCAQLIERYKLSYSIPLHPDNTRDGNFLVRLLNEIATEHLQPTVQLVIAVDALDEVDLNSQSAGANVLYLPASLPNSIYFILTKRPEPLPLGVNNQHIFDLMQYPAESRQDVERFIRRSASESPSLRQQILSLREKPTVEEFITTLAHKSENNFMYLRYVLLAIEEGAYQDLSVESLPQGLEDYYYQHWQRMGMTAKPLPRTKIKIVYILAELPEPVSRKLISEFTGETELTVQEVLNEWQQFLHDKQERYSFYHASFRDFLHRQEIVQAAGVTIPGIKALIADSLSEELGL